eukprot:TRINITY_DN834_c0_g1_i9.p1 TRINITY_DN834_c0_g1~~TRINITY_DN834_c0_g1_i9.p1  ORF type:complete len:357 (-),score=67.24 TRINITY_DN834_c0_g1_i9:117-1187(-)
MSTEPSKPRRYSVEAGSAGSDRRLSEFEDQLPIYRFVLTGGPCAGKTTALARLSAFLRGRGFRVFTVPEAATLLFSNGATFNDLPEQEQQLQFQANLLKTQMHLEDTFFGLAQLIDKPAVLLCDRGTMDGSCYIERATWEGLLKRHGMDTVSIRDGRYTAVLHMVTAADGAEEFYQTENNSVREESPEEARQLDQKLRNAWVGHPKLFVFENRPGKTFEDKLQEIVGTVSRLVGLPESTRSTRKFVIKKPDLSNFMVRYESFHVEKVYLLTRNRGLPPTPGGSKRDFTFVRRRQETSTGLASFGLTSVTFQNQGNKGTEVKRIITHREYDHAVATREDTSRHRVHQLRISFLWDAN